MRNTPLPDLFSLLEKIFGVGRTLVFFKISSVERAHMQHFFVDHKPANLAEAI